MRCWFVMSSWSKTTWIAFKLVHHRALSFTHCSLDHLTLVGKRSLQNIWVSVCNRHTTKWNWNCMSWTGNGRLFVFIIELAHLLYLLELWPRPISLCIFRILWRFFTNPFHWALAGCFLRFWLVSLPELKLLRISRFKTQALLNVIISRIVFGCDLEQRLSHLCLLI